jgi:hypothetical protein
LVSLRLPGYRCANGELGRLNPHPESTAKSASVPGNARVPVLGQHGLDNRLLRPGPTLPVTEGTVHRHVRLGGLLSFYQRRKQRSAS